MWTLLSGTWLTDASSASSGSADNLWTVLVTVISASGILVGNILLRRRRENDDPLPDPPPALPGEPPPPAAPLAQNIVSRLEAYLEERVVELENEVARIRTDRDRQVSRLQGELVQAKIELAQMTSDRDTLRNQRIYGDGGGRHER